MHEGDDDATELTVCPECHAIWIIWDALLINRRFYLLLFNLAFIQSAFGTAAARYVLYAGLISFAPFVTGLIEWEVSGCVPGGSRLSLRAQLRRLSSHTKRNWIPQKPTQPVRFNRAFKHSHWPLWVGFVCDYSSRNRSEASFPRTQRAACVASDTTRNEPPFCAHLTALRLAYRHRL